MAELDGAAIKAAPRELSGFEISGLQIYVRHERGLKRVLGEQIQDVSQE